MHPTKSLAALALAYVATACAAAATPQGFVPLPPQPKISEIADAFAGSSINTVIFRHSPLVSHGTTQYAAFYDKDARVILAKRTLNTPAWETRPTPFTGNVRDAHNTISLGIDAKGILHISWDHHGNALNYARSTAPGSLELTARLPMDGLRENRVTYPEFYSLPDGNLLCLYRDGASGSGDLVLKKYDASTEKWASLAPNLIAGEGRQNAYPQFTVGPDGTFHLSWVWRRTPDVATNHDLCYARSKDGGKTWTNSTGTPVTLPITAATAEIALKIPERSDLMNQTTIAGDAHGRPFIATYFRPLGEPSPGIPQYHVIYHDGKTWHTSQVGKRTTGFSLGGGGTLRIPMSRPLMVVDGGTAETLPRAHLIFRDAERGEKATLATTADIQKNTWTLRDLTTDALGAWEPSYDPTLWTQQKTLSLFIQKTEQISGNDNTLNSVPPTKVRVLDIKP